MRRRIPNVDGSAVQRMRKYRFGAQAEPTEETWDERQARVQAEREARRLEREAESNQE